MRRSSPPIPRPARQPGSSGSTCRTRRSRRSPDRRRVRKARWSRRAADMPGLFDEPFEDAPLPQEATAPSRVRRRVVTVSEATAEIRATLESGFGELWIEGEISNCRVWNTGHVYFTLKDSTAQ